MLNPCKCGGVAHFESNELLYRLKCSRCSNSVTVKIEISVYNSKRTKIAKDILIKEWNKQNPHKITNFFQLENEI